jgi:hypothetical protein
VEHIGSLETALQKKSHVNSWTDAIAGALFARFDVKTQGSTYALAGHCATETKARLAAAGCSGFDVSTACRDEGLPLPIVVACVAVPDAPQVYFPLEFTPMYSGACITSLLIIQAECTQCMHAPRGAACRAVLQCHSGFLRLGAGLESPYSSPGEELSAHVACVPRLQLR